MDGLINRVAELFPICLRRPVGPLQVTDGLESVFGSRELPEEAMGKFVQHLMVREGA
ncbi:MAG: hypothetical protein MT490_06420 [Sphingomonas sp.]|uniref:hypothetical protein n=1 Tax=Sphingomonas sp. TaxID=28214 RepID=UPI002274615C|nr:hypothetical protein [Sphingomonas sp.]MCX8475415.1 hypothetical protein [Sphingomonas sp.]